ncbi:MAG: hypothetical protein ACPHRO_10990, partial [Nannocystaceae bacterium]
VHLLLESSSPATEIEPVLKTMTAHGEFDASAQAQAYFNTGRFAVESSNLRRAIAAFAAAGDVANRVAMADVTMAAGIEELYVTAMLGDAEGFARRVDPIRVTLKDAGLSDCDYGRGLSNLAWSSMVVEETRDSSDFSKALEILEEARPLFDVGGGCEDDKSRIDATLNMAFAHLRRGELTKAEARLRSLGSPETSQQEQWKQLIHGMVEAARGNTGDGLRTLVGVVTRAGTQENFDLAWRAIIAAADVSYERGDVEGSLNFHRAANRLISDQLWSVSANDARELFVAARGGAGRTEEAWCQFRLSRTMALRTFMQSHGASSDPGDARQERVVQAWRERRARQEASKREDWGRSGRELERAKSLREREAGELQAELDLALQGIEQNAREVGMQQLPTCDSLASIAPGELWIGLLPASEGRMIGLFASESGIKHGEFVAPSSIEKDAYPVDDEGSHEVLAAIDDELEQSQSVQILGHSSFVMLDVHAMQWRGRPLIRARPV